VEIVKGSAAGTSVIVRTNPGTEDHPILLPGNEVVLFLVKDGDKEIYRTFGLSQGKFDIQDGLVVRDGLPLATFLDKIRSLIARSAPGEQ
jgi:hypothetical protein